MISVDLVFSMLVFFFLEKEIECHDFMENFTFGLCMGNFALSVLCKVLMDMKSFELDFISETTVDD